MGKNTASPTKKRDTLKADRNDALYKDYLALLEELGPMANQTTMKYKCEKLEEKWFITAHTIGVIIGKKLKEKTKKLP